MPKIAKKLDESDINLLEHPGNKNFPMIFAVGGDVAGLSIQITLSGSKSWILRTMVKGKRREFGLGPYPETPMEIAKELAREIKLKVRNEKIYNAKT